MNTIPIKYLNDERLSLYIGYNEPQLLHYNEPEPGIFIAETPMVIERAIEYGARPLSFFVEEKAIRSERVQELLQYFPGLDVFTAPIEVINKITGFNLTRGVLAAFTRNPLPEPGELLSSSKHVVILEDIVNPTNIGAIFRSGSALGADCVLLTSASSDPLYRRSARVSMGTVFQIPWTYIPKGQNAVDLLHEYRYDVISMELTPEAVPVNDPSLKTGAKTALIFGAEGSGISPETLSKSDHIAIIPLRNGVDSLNVAASSAVAIYELFG